MPNDEPMPYTPTRLMPKDETDSNKAEYNVWDVTLYKYRKRQRKRREEEEE